jgi:hypothetical protein
MTMRFPTMPREPRDHQLSVRIPLRVYQALEAQAETERRTVADVLNNLLDERYPFARSRRRP